MMRKLHDRFGSHLNTSAARNVIDHDWQFGLICYRRKVGNHAALIRLVVWRYHDQRVVNAFDLSHFIGKGNRFGSIVAASAGNYRHAAINDLGKLTIQSELFVMTERWRLTSRTANDKTVAALFDQMVGQLGQTGKVQFILFIKWCYDGS